MSDTTLSSLDNIKIKTRRLTTSPSTSQLSESELEDYINNFILYDFLSIIKTEILSENLYFYTEKGIDTYENDDADATNPLYNFKNKYIVIKPPVYISGTEGYFSQSQQEFYDMYPKILYKNSETTGDGGTTNFTGTLTNIPLLVNSLFFNAIDVSGNTLKIVDDGDGTLSGDGSGTIDYETGDYDITFDHAIESGEGIYSNYYPYQATKPNTVLYLGNKFVVRPVPDNTYKIEIAAMRRPTELLADDELPDISQWWQYIAYGAAIKILQDRLDFETVNLLVVEFKRQESMIFNNIASANSSKRAPTIYAID